MNEKKQITIRLDASFDLHAAGHNNDDNAVSQFEAAYRDAAEREAEDRGIEILVVTPGEPEYVPYSTSDDEEENEIWQAIHDRLDFIDGEWM